MASKARTDETITNTIRKITSVGSPAQRPGRFSTPALAA
jgi:hypothetical protein